MTTIDGSTMTTPPPRLRDRVLRAGAWTVVGHASGQVLRFGSNLLMTRLLVPEMFGTMALANVLLIGLQLVSDLGLRQNIVQSPRGHEPAFLDTVWTVQILRGVLISAATLLLALALHLLGRLGWLPAGSAYAEPALPAVAAVLSLQAVINGMESTKYATASRRLTLGRLTLLELTCQAGGIAFMVAWVLVQRSIWALVAGALVTSLLRVALGFALLPGEWNRLHWEKQAFQEILKFGKWIFATSILGFLAANGDRLVLGGLVDSRTLGMYSIGLFMVGAVKETLGKLLANVAFPALSEVARDRPASLREVYYRFRLPLDVVSGLAAGLLFLAGHLLVRVLYDARYASVGHILEILSIALVEQRYSLAGQCFMALGRPKLLAPIIGIQAAALYVLMPLAFARHGFEGALWVAGCAVLLTIPVTITLKVRLQLFDLRRELATLPWLGAGLAIGLAVTQLAALIGWPR